MYCKVFQATARRPYLSCATVRRFRFCSTPVSCSDSLPLSKVVKIHCCKTLPDRLHPWQTRGLRNGTGSGFVIEGNKILTNAHVVSDGTFVTVTKHSCGTHFTAEVEAISHESDLALLRVCDSPAFFEDIGHLHFGELPSLQESVTVLGYPCGGETISVTRGVVSRLEMVQFVHASHSLLGIQIDAAINSGNSGGPALLNGAVIGVAFQNVPDAESIGYIIPAVLVHRFLADARNARKGFCSLGVACQPLTDTHTIQRFLGGAATTQTKQSTNNSDGQSRDDAKILDESVVVHSADNGCSEALEDTISGVLVTKVVKNTPAHGVLKKYDVITEIDGHSIFNDGMTVFRATHGDSVGMDHWISQKFAGESLPLTVFRDGALQSVECRLEVCELSVARQLYGVPSHYWVFGGCVFQPLSVPFLQTYGDDWFHNAPRELVTEVMKSNVKPAKRWQPNAASEQLATGQCQVGDDCEEIVVMSTVLPHALNMGCDRHCNLIVESVGGTRIQSLRHLKHVIETRVAATLSADSSVSERCTAEGNLLDVCFNEGRMMVLPLAECFAAESEILDIHRVPKRQSASMEPFDLKIFNECRQKLY